MKFRENKEDSIALLIFIRSERPRAAVTFKIEYPPE